MNRRTLLKTTATLAAGSPLLGIDPIERTGKPKLKLSLAAYSFRRQLTAKPGTPGAMDMLGFIDWASNQDLDAVEPTSYFFPKEVTPGYLAKLRRRAHLQGVDISSGAIRNVFTLPDGPELNKWHAHVDTWIDHYAAIGYRGVRTFAYCFKCYIATLGRSDGEACTGKGGVKVSCYRLACGNIVRLKHPGG